MLKALTIFYMLSSQTFYIHGHSPPTIFDNMTFRPLFHAFRNYIFMSVGRTSRNIRGVAWQETFPDSQPFPCPMNNTRSPEVPNSIHKLRPGDIDVIAAMGDSLTAGSGANAKQFIEVFMENRGLAWSIGGQYNWRNVTTLPNILKVFNPQLVGYSRDDAFPMHSDSQFNVAEVGAVSADLPFMAKTLVQRIRRDRRVNFKKNWKMVTICMGGNDFCSFVCTMKDPESLPALHGQNLLKTLRYIRDNMPRTFVNVVTEPSPIKIVTSKTNPRTCEIINHLECSCFVGQLYAEPKSSFERYNRIHTEFSRVEEQVARSAEFRGLKEFAVVFQPLTRQLSLKTKNSPHDYSLLAYDCFHMSQKGNAWAGTTLWNNMLQRDGEKDVQWRPPKEKFLCPTKDRPYILTYDNMLT